MTIWWWWWRFDLDNFEYMGRGALRSPPSQSITDSQSFSYFTFPSRECVQVYKGKAHHIMGGARHSLTHSVGESSIFQASHPDRPYGYTRSHHAGRALAEWVVIPHTQSNLNQGILINANDCWFCIRYAKDPIGRHAATRPHGGCLCTARMDLGSVGRLYCTAKQTTVLPRLALTLFLDMDAYM